MFHIVLFSIIRGIHFYNHLFVPVALVDVGQAYQLTHQTGSINSGKFGQLSRYVQFCYRLHAIMT